MNDKQFDELLESVRDMGRHMQGDVVAGVKECVFPEPDVKAIRERTGLSQTRFAYLIEAKPKPKPKTLQSWEQHRARPAGPARALLKIVEANPSALLVLHV